MLKISDKMGVTSHPRKSFFGPDPVLARALIACHLEDVTASRQYEDFSAAKWSRAEELLP